ncbi:citrate/2-methylcitrate synthase [Georgenia alba]|uniref:citrate synthase (unknown stereospecificity) n=1 Tax=Georgenia alba TaxID=2233858 RepID=A0ABW2Q6N0_9MICO
MGATPPIFVVDDDDEPRYRGVRLSEVLGTPFDRLWGLLVGSARGLPPAEPYRLPVRTGDTRADVLSALAQLTPAWSYRPLGEISVPQARDNLARASAMTLSFVAQSARGEDVPAVPQREVDLVETVTERFLVRWRGEADPAAVRALDAFWLAVAENGLSPSTRTARLAAEVGSDVASCLAAAVAVAGSPFLGGAVARCLALVEQAERTGAAPTAVAEHLDAHGSLPGFGDGSPSGVRARAVREACVTAGARRLQAADAVAAAGTEALRGRGVPPDRAVPSTVFWGAVLLDHIGVPPRLMCAFYLCGRTAGWSAHVLEVHAGRN